MNNFFRNGAEQVSTPNDLNAESAPVQNFAFGGIANPVQKPYLSAADREYLEARQAELDRFEQERQAYNTALSTWQNEVYNPYKSQVEAYNAAAQKYNTEVYQPYEQQYNAYQQAITDWNAGPRTTEYAGPAAPTLSKTFDLTEPVAPSVFDKQAPVLPFKEEDVTAYQKEAAARAEKAAQGRAVAIDVVSDPDRFNFGSMGISKQFMAKGGLAEANAYNMADEEDTPIDTNPVGTAQQFVDRLAATVSPEGQKAKAPMRIRALPRSGGAARPKSAGLQLEELVQGSLGEMKDFAPKARETDSARAQLDEMVRQYALKTRAAQDRAKGLGASTFNAPTLEGTTLTKNRLAKKRFKDGGEAKKSDADQGPSASEGLPSPGIVNFQLWADTVSREMYPSEREYTKRDAARHMLAAALLANKTSPGIAEGLGKFHEFKEAPFRTAGHWLGLSEPRGDYKTDVHNNALGAALADAAKDPRQLEMLVRQAIKGGTTNGVEKGRVSLTPDDLSNMGYGSVQPGVAASQQRMRKREAQGFAKGGVVKVLKGTKAVDEAGKPVMTYRGEYGSSPGLSSELGSLSFGTKDAANLYATSPNNAAKSVEASKVFPSYLSIRKPLMNDPQDPFIDLGTLRKALGKKEFDRVVKSNIDFIQGTNAFEELADAKGYKSALEVMKKDPKAFDQLYTDIYPILDDAKTVKALQKRGYDGAIYGGSGATAMEPEYRVFSASQAISPYGNKPMAPRSAGQQFGDLLRSMEVSPTDALNFLGRAGGAAASALTPSTLNEGEDAELARRRAMPPTVDRAEGSPKEGETSIKDQLIGAGETALTLGSGALASLAGMPVGLYKGLTSGKYLEGKAPAIAAKEAQDFIERNTYVPRSETGRANLEALGKLMEKSKLPPVLPEALVLSSIPRAAVAAQGERIGMAAEKALEKPVRRTLEKGGKGAELLKALSPPPAYAVRPTGSTMLTGSVGFRDDVSGVDQILREGLSGVRSAAGQSDEQAKILSDFWDKKARNYFTRQFGTPDDPIADAIAKQRIKGSALEETFPKYLLDQITVGKTRVNEQGQERFFPKYPRAMEDFQQRYDAATGLKGNVIGTQPGLASTEYTYSMSDAGRALQQLAKTQEEDRLLAQGVRPELINANVGVVTRSFKAPERVIGEGTGGADALLKAYEEAQAYSQMPMAEQMAWADKQFGEGRKLHGLLPEDVGPGILSQNVKTAIDKGEPVYDIGGMGSPLSKLFRTQKINEYLASLPPREAASIRFEDAVRGALKMGEDQAQMDVLVSRIKAGKPVADAVFSKGVSAPLVQFNEGPLAGFAWKRIEDRKATVPEGAYVGHSVGGYELGGPTYTTEKRDGFNTGKYQIYTLRDNRNRPVNTIEVKMLDEATPVVTQIKGNGRATGNTAPEKYDAAVLEFLQGYLKPALITESDSYLTPLLQTYKNALTPPAAR